MKTMPIQVLLVDDDPEDVDLTMEVLLMSKIKVGIQIAKDGEEAMSMLLKCLDEKPPVLPDLILLDLNMPRKNGHEVLAEIKANRYLQHIPVVVLTTSGAQEDISLSYKKGVSCYVKKPVGLPEFQRVVEAINDFWFTVVKFPSTDE